MSASRCATFFKLACRTFGASAGQGSDVDRKTPPPLLCGPIAGLSKPACQSLCLENRSARSAGPCLGLAHGTQGSCRGTGQMGKAKVVTFSTVWFHIVVSCSPENESEWKPLFFVLARVPSWSARPSVISSSLRLAGRGWQNGAPFL